jgi:hypothetical protein
MSQKREVTDTKVIVKPDQTVPRKVWNYIPRILQHWQRADVKAGLIGES